MWITAAAQIRADPFQSAPRSEERGDVEFNNYVWVICMFQSAPRSEERGDFASCGRMTMFRRFQSAPRSEERGDCADAQGSTGPPGVSIRAPLRGAGRSLFVNDDALAMFVSIRAPLRGAGRW